MKRWDLKDSLAALWPIIAIHRGLTVSSFRTMLVPSSVHMIDFKTLQISRTRCRIWISRCVCVIETGSSFMVAEMWRCLRCHLNRLGSSTSVGQGDGLDSSAVDYYPCHHLLFSHILSLPSWKIKSVALVSSIRQFRVLRFSCSAFSHLLALCGWQLLVCQFSSSFFVLWCLYSATDVIASLYSWPRILQFRRRVCARQFLCVCVVSTLGQGR